MNKRVLIAGESWVTHSIHTKGFDSFTTTEYNEGVRWLKAALEGGGWEVTFGTNSSGKYLIPDVSGFEAACPSPQIEASRIA